VIINSYNVTFIEIVLSGNKLKANIKHIGMHNSNIVVCIWKINQRGEKVLKGTAKIAQSMTVYIFTGRGSQEPEMGMELYNNSPAARSV
jgi:fatty acid synthase subunit alpha, fungi type